MPNITFQPSNITITANPGDVLSEAAREAGISVETPCGGNGVCRKCLVRVVSGEVDFPGDISVENRADGWVLICVARVKDSDVVVNTFYDIDAEQGKFHDQTADLSAIDESLLPNSSQIDFVVKRISITVGEPKFGDGLSDFDRLKIAVMAQFSCRDITLPLSVLCTLPDVLRTSDGKIALHYYLQNGVAHIVDIVSDGAETEMYGLAVDIGTTTVAVSIIDSVGQIIGGKTGYNAQIACGLDVISRINYAKSPKHLAELKNRVTGTINSVTDALCKTHGIGASQIYNASIAANTVMVHMLLGIVPEQIRLSPYTPAVYAVPHFAAGELGLNIHPHAPVYIAPSVGSYVGGDITAGLLCTPLATDAEELCLFIDIGTNGEIVLGNGDFLLGCACSAGPAFEGGGIKHGMRASEGAIERVEVDSESGEPKCSIIGNAAPKGICGSGMISLAAELFGKGYIDPMGKLQGKPSGAITDKNYTLAKGETHDITVSEMDINNLIRAKAAVFSACRTMLSSIDMSFDDLSKIYIAGGFGRYLNIGDAKAIGLIPNLPDDKFVFIGNSSFMGAYMALISAAHREKQTELAQKITYLDLGAEPSYMDEYMAASFLPHTDASLFS